MIPDFCFRFFLLPLQRYRTSMTKQMLKWDYEITGDNHPQNGG